MDPAIETAPWPRHDRRVTGRAPHRRSATSERTGRKRRAGDQASGQVAQWRTSFRDPSSVGLHPTDLADAVRYLAAMNLIVLILVLLLLFGGGGFYFGGPAIGGGGLGLVLLIALIVFLMGGFRTKS